MRCVALIREKELLDAIAECQGERNPNANTCIKLASYYTILDHMEDPARMLPDQPAYSYDSAPEDRYESKSEFGQAVKDASPLDVLRVVDELMETLRIMQPKLYDAFIRKVTTLD